MRCDSCNQMMFRDVNGYWVDVDGTADCPDAPVEGHAVDGQVR